MTYDRWKTEPPEEDTMWMDDLIDESVRYDMGIDFASGSSKTSLVLRLADGGTVKFEPCLNQHGDIDVVRTMTMVQDYLTENC
jgi:hypothetical protein